MIVQKDVHLDESVHFLLAPFVPQSTATRSIEAQRLCGAFQYFRFSPLSFDLENDGDYVGKCRSALTQGAASAGGCSALSRAG